MRIRLFIKILQILILIGCGVAVVTRESELKWFMLALVAWLQLLNIEIVISERND